MSDEALPDEAPEKPGYSAEERVRALVRMLGRQANCRLCKGVIYWATTKNDKRMPLDADGISHWATCPHADRFRTKK